MSKGGELVHNSVRDILDVLFRHKWKAVVFCAFTVCAVTAYTYLTAEIYRSEAKLLLRLGRENLAVDPSVPGPTLGLIQDRDREVTSELAILTSRQLAEQIVDEIGPEAFLRRPDEAESDGAWKGTPQEQLRPARRQVRAVEDAGKGLLVSLDLAPALTPRLQAVKRLQDSLSVEVEKNTNILTVAIEAQSGRLAQSALDRLVKLYLERHIAVHASQASPTFFEEQASKLREDLAQREQQLDAYRREAGIAAIERQKEVLLDQIRALETARDESAAKASATGVEVAALRKALGGTRKEIEVSRTSGFTNFAADYLKQRLADMRRDEMDLAARYAEDYRPLVELRQQIAQIQAALQQEEETHTQVETGLNTNYQTLELAMENKQAELQAEETRRDALSAALERQKTALDALAGRELEYERLVREKDLAEAEYREYRDNLQRARVSAALDIDKVSNVRVVQDPTLPLGPVRPNKLRNIALGVLAGVVGGIALGFAAQHLDDTLKTDTEVSRRLKLPVLASVSDGEFRSCI